VRLLYFDCVSGISGDMTVGALADLGVPTDHTLAELAKLELDGEFAAHFQRGQRQHVAGSKFSVVLPAATRPLILNPSAHVHGRNHREIRELIQASSLSDFVKEKSLAIFQRIAVAEGKIHDVPPEAVGFHEVGAVDSIVDIVAACVGVEWLRPNAIGASELFEGTGTIQCAHGRLPLPAPATLEILRGIPLRQIAEPLEFITPTGAAIVAEFATSFTPFPALRVERVGYGLGTRDTPNRPNVLRAFLGETTEGGWETDVVIQAETNLDDLSPELLAPVLQSLLAAGALEAFLTPIQMKKNRPGWLLTFLATEEKWEELAQKVFRETTAFGLRFQRLSRLKLAREIREVVTPFGPVAIKLGYLHGERVQASPEFDSCARAAEAHGVAVREVYQAAQFAALEL